MKWVKRIAVLIAVLAVALIGTALAMRWRFAQAMAHVYDIRVEDLAIPTSTQTIARGRHVATALGGCLDCHGEDLGGKVVIDEEPIGRIVSSNLTTGRGGVAGKYTTAAAWDRAIRHGIRYDGTPLTFMPSADYYPWSDEDTAAVIAYVRSVPPVDKEPPRTELGFLPPFLDTFDLMLINHARRIDHAGTRAAAPTPAPTAVYGKHIALACTGCHGQGFSGGPLPGAPPTMPVPTNLTSHADGLGKYTYETFAETLRTGVRPDGTKLDPFMPIQVTKHLNDVEMRALFEFLSSLPPVATGNR